jgi:hypothetical protein
VLAFPLSVTCVNSATSVLSSTGLRLESYLRGCKRRCQANRTTANLEATAGNASGFTGNQTKKVQQNQRPRNNFIFIESYSEEEDGEKSSEASLTPRSASHRSGSVVASSMCSKSATGLSSFSQFSDERKLRIGRG